MTTRRNFIGQSLAGGAGLFIAPTIIPASSTGKHAPSNRISIGAIGTGRISRDRDMPGVLKYDNARIIAVADLDARRAAEGKQYVESIRTGRPNITPAEVAHRSCSACLLLHIAMKLQRRLYRDPTLERFRNDDEANAMIARPHRPPYQF
jgi:hypothetical protein